MKPKGTGMELLPSEYVAKRLKTEVETFIMRFKSIPAVTANLTMENFQKHTAS
jgi:mitotic spindle assembly checkpoint protein MAD1